ncbi:MAG: hypothetical protein ACYDAR_03205, partial [Thermomicrobiales bacterium]
AAMLIARRYAEEQYAARAPDTAGATETRTAWMRLRKLVVQSALPGNRRKNRENPDAAPPIQPRGRRQR